ncbi:hypothetical protein vseg_012200 [Gypsophila vaccaria]
MESPSRCPICLTEIRGQPSAKLTKCLHAYCVDCLVRWSNYKRTCPLCNSPFDSYFSSPSFRHRHRLRPLCLPLRPAPSRPRPLHRVLRRTREEVNAANRRSRPAPRLRSFGQPRLVPADVIKERVLQWRTSIYERGLRAIPFDLRTMMNNRDREEVLRRIEPWIRRELQAVLQDPDPTVIVHVATSLYLKRLENKTGVVSFCEDSEDSFLVPLRPFLGDWTSTFWHELRCFAESCYTMDTYDEVVNYRDSVKP